MDLNVWMTFVIASTALLFIPGPTVLLVLSYAINHGRGVALATVVGVALGDLIAMTASLVGLGALVLASATLFTLLKWVGAIYLVCLVCLVCLGIKLFRSASDATIQLEDSPETSTARSVFTHAAVVTALNPKSIVFFIAFVPQFVHPELSLVPQFSILIITFVTLAATNALAYALLADKMRQRIARPVSVNHSIFVYYP